MDHPSIDNVQELQKEIAELKEKIVKLEQQIAHIQKKLSAFVFRDAVHAKMCQMSLYRDFILLNIELVEGTCQRI
jgi:FtsZ-binding cell division protein ZapB